MELDFYETQDTWHTRVCVCLSLLSPIAHALTSSGE